MALTLAWVESEIENCLQGANSAKNVTDFAILCIARDNLRAMQAQEPAKEDDPQKANARPPIIMTQSDVQLDTIPKVEQIGAAIDAAATVAYEPDEKRRVQDLRTWKDILEGSSRRG